MKKVALIGATGFVGSHLLQELLDRGYGVTALARSVEKIQTENTLKHLVDILVFVILNQEKNGGVALE